MRRTVTRESGSGADCAADETAGCDNGDTAGRSAGETAGCGNGDMVDRGAGETASCGNGDTTACAEIREPAAESMPGSRCPSVGGEAGNCAWGKSGGGMGAEGSSNQVSYKSYSTQRPDATRIEQRNSRWGAFRKSEKDQPLWIESAMSAFRKRALRQAGSLSYHRPPRAIGNCENSRTGCQPVGKAMATPRQRGAGRFPKVLRDAKHGYFHFSEMHPSRS